MQMRDPRLIGVCLACQRPIAHRRSAWRPLLDSDDGIIHCSDCARFLEGYFSITFVKDRGYFWAAWASLHRCQSGEQPLGTGYEDSTIEAQNLARLLLAELGLAHSWQGSAHSARSHRRRESLSSRVTVAASISLPQPQLEENNTPIPVGKDAKSRRVA